MGEYSTFLSCTTVNLYLFHVELFMEQLTRFYSDTLMEILVYEELLMLHTRWEDGSGHMNTLHLKKKNP